ncbi:membrane-associated phosphatidylinositol transfer protein 2-like isoform X2 [Bolinopsis microptera]|uniref:membrane-associated phosphatidylinositol transfer protein 2-like isoform X2 n=1 Tax=Bolinopsis microptera TaxID=2820187 RepID=UPI0030795A26
MLIKEYRIPLPMSVEEYKIAQLYMIQRKSKEESQGRNSGIEIVENKPYTDGPGGEGQYTKKIYHIAGHVPQYIKNVIPKSARSLHEEAWNAYPYARTKFSCEFVPRFVLDIESRYVADCGTQENIFNLSPEELAQREVVFLDVVTDRVDGEPLEEENPLLFRSDKTGRGPLKATWIKDEEWEHVFCAYKLCRVDFPFWGFQTRVERYANDYGIRKILVKAHRQAWVWQDSYHGLTIEDIRQLEYETQEMLQRLYAEEGTGTTPTNSVIPTPSPPRLDAIAKLESSSCLSQLSLTVSDSESEYFDANDYNDEEEDPHAFLYHDNNDHPKLISTNSADSAKSDDSHGHGRLLPSQKLLFIVFHGGTLLDMNTDTTKLADCQTLHQSLSNVINTLCPTYRNRIEIKLVQCPQVCADVVASLVGSLPSVGPDRWQNECLDHGYGLSGEVEIPFELIPVLTCQTAKYQEGLKTVCREANSVFNAYREEDSSFTHNQVTVIGDVVGSILAYDILCHSDEELDPGKSKPDNVCQSPGGRFDFLVDKFFSFGSPIGNLVLHRALQNKPVHPKKLVTQFYNLFYASSPGAVRIEPVLDGHFASFPPICIPRFNKSPYGAGTKYNINSFLERNHTFLQDPIHPINPSIATHDPTSTSASLVRPITTSSLGMSGVSEWWGTKRIDYALYYPEALRSFPSLILPALLHSSYWENYDVAAFVVQQVLGLDEALPSTPHITPRNTETDLLAAAQSASSANNTEKWLRRRTKLKVNNLNPNHRCFDTIYLEGQEQEIFAKFFYGPLDALSLVGEKVDISIMDPHPGGEYNFLGTQVTSQGGRINFKIPENYKFGTGLYPVKCTVRGDKSTAEGFMAVVPPGTECVVFSIDGSFTLNMSLMGRDAKIRPGAVEVVRLWQELGFVIIYITARPDLQKESVLEWLGTHNFPHGIVAFSDGISPTDLLKDKMEYLIRLKNECKLNIYAAYGSSKDINVYQSAGIPLSKMYIVKPKNPKRKHQLDDVFTIDYETYGSHLTMLRQLMKRRASSTLKVPHLTFKEQKETSPILVTSRRISKDRRDSTSQIGGSRNVISEQ